MKRLRLRAIVCGIKKGDYPLASRKWSGVKWRPVAFLIMFLVVMGLIQWLRSVFQSEITIGDIFATATPLMIAGIFLLSACLKNSKPFSFKFANQPFDSVPETRRHRTYSQKKHFALGRSILTIAVRTRVETIANPFDIRFVERSIIPWKWRDAKENDIHIIEVSVPDWDREASSERDYTGPNNVSIIPNEVGGFIVTTRLPKRWIAGRILWIEITIEAERPWSGHLSFEGGTDKLGYARRPVRAWAEFG